MIMEIQMLIRRLEEVYKFEDKGGELKNCGEWVRLKNVMEEMRVALRDLLTVVPPNMEHSTVASNARVLLDE